jgi:bacterial/archaeal transporter family protein
MTRWLALALLCTLLWGIFGLLAKLGSASASPSAMQVLFTVGMMPLVIAAFFKNKRGVETDARGIAYGTANGMLSGLGGLAYFAAMVSGKAALVGPVTALYPLVTVLLAAVVLKEKLNLLQIAGIATAVIAVALLSVPD